MTVGVAARLQPDGQVLIGTVAWSTGDLGLPHRGVDLPVRAGGKVFGHFLLDPVPGVRVDHASLLVAVAIADQVGAALAAARTEVPGARLTGGARSHDAPTPAIFLKRAARTRHR